MHVWRAAKLMNVMVIVSKHSKITQISQRLDAYITQ